MKILLYTLLTILVVSCGRNSKATAPLDNESALKLAKEYLLSKYQITTDQGRVYAQKFKIANWPLKYYGEVIYEKKGFRTKKREYIVVHILKDHHLYYMDYYILMDIKSREVLSVIERMSEG